MNKKITLAVVLLTISFSASPQQSQTELAIEKMETPETFDEVTVNHEDYTLQISLENTHSNNPILVIAMELKNNAHFISPLEEKEFKGKFHFDFGSYKDLGFKGEVSESPISETIVLYPNFNGGGDTKWVRENTIYKQALHLKTAKDFEVFGRIQFTIEPRCTFEEIPFAISYKDGKMVFIESKC